MSDAGGRTRGVGSGELLEQALLSLEGRGSRRRGLGDGGHRAAEQGCSAQVSEAHHEEGWPPAERRHGRALLLSRGDERDRQRRWSRAWSSAQKGYGETPRRLRSQEARPAVGGRWLLSHPKPSQREQRNVGKYRKRDRRPHEHWNHGRLQPGIGSSHVMDVEKFPITILGPSVASWLRRIRTSRFDDESGRRSGFRSAKTLQKFSSVRAQVHNLFNQERHLVTREVYKQRRPAA